MSMHTEIGFGEFTEAQLPRLLGYARVLAGNEHDAWDLVQETLTRMACAGRRSTGPAIRSATPGPPWHD